MKKSWKKPEGKNILPIEEQKIRIISFFSDTMQTRELIGKKKLYQPKILCPAVLSFKSEGEGFPGGAVVENLPANAGDTGSGPGLGRSHMPQSN